MRCLILAGILSLPGSVLAADVSGAGNEPPHPLTQRGLENLHAFARLYGVVRYFHPSDQAWGADWDQLALAGVQKVEAVGNAAELAQALRAIFLPVAPTARIFLTGAKAPPPSPWLAPRHGKNVGLTAWRYDGYSLTSDSPESGGTYHRELLFPLAQEEKPYSVDLGDGVSAIVPLSVYRDVAGTFPHQPDASIKPDKSDGFVPSGNDRTTRLAGIVEAWNVLQHFFPNFDLTPVDWPAEMNVALQEAATDKDALAFRDTLNRMLATLRDGHGFVSLHGLTRYWLPLDWDWVEGQLTIMAVGKDVSGIARGDVVVKLDGRDIADVMKDRAPLNPAATEQYLKYNIEKDLLLRDSGAPVPITVRHADGSTTDVTLALEKSVRGTKRDGAAMPSLAPTSEVKPGIWYVDLSRVEWKDLDALLPQLADARGIVFDLRAYPKSGMTELLGHLTDRDLRLGRFLHPVISRPDRQGLQYDDTSELARPASPKLNARIVFLCGSGTVSYGETLMAAVDDFHLGTIVGSATAGTNGAEAPFTLPGGYWVSWSGERVERLDGRRFTGVGIVPTVPVSETLAGLCAGRDDVLERGLQIVEGDN